MAIEIRIWDEREWSQSRGPYEALLRESGADLLFHSWDWLDLWWRHLGRVSTGDRLLVFAAFEEDRLVGLMPMVSVMSRSFGPVRLRTLQGLGTTFADSRGIVSEYQDAIAAPVHLQAVRGAIAAAMISMDGQDDIVVAWTEFGGEWVAAFSEARGASRSKIRIEDPSISYQAELNGGFEAYLRSIGSSTRRSLYGLRRRLAELGVPRITTQSGDNAVQALETMARLHARRWKAALFTPSAMDFHRALVDRWKGTGRIQFSVLDLDNEAVSVLYDIRVGSVQYNIQMGFRPDLSRRLSLGLIHLGYAMEAAANEGVLIYDYLAGRGMRNDYKRNLSTRSRSLRTVHCVKAPMAALAYGLVDIRRYFRKSLFR